MSGDELSFADLKGQTLVKAPGSINGESFTIKNLEECSVFILDYSSEVEVSNCTSCQIFVGPVDGLASFTGCTNCQVAVASNGFRADGCTNCEFGLFSATQPAISGCSGIRIGCWAGAYAQLSRHFAAANLDPGANQWNKVYDASADEGAPPNFELVTELADYWEVPLESFGPPENPVPGPDGQLYQPPAVAAPAPDAAFGAGEGAVLENGTGEAPVAAPPPAGGAIPDDFLAAGGEHVPSDQAETVSSGLLEPAAAGGDHPAVAAAKARLQQRMKEQAAKEAEEKRALQATAAKYLEQFYERRNKSKEERIKLGRQASAGKGNGELGPSGDSEPDRVISMIDFNLARPNGTDLSRFKSVLFTCKAKGSMPSAVPVPAN